MVNMVMGNMDGNLERVAFSVNDIRQILNSSEANLVASGEEPGLFLELNGAVCPVQGKVDRKDIKPYFIILDSGIAYNASSYQILFNVKELPNSLLRGTDVFGREHLCQKYMNGKDDSKAEDNNIVYDEIQRTFQTRDLSSEDAESLKIMIQKLKEGEFFELLTMEFSGRIKEVAKELINFRKDIQERIEPDIVEIASRDIPEASNQLEGINETLEESTMKIMDINEELMEMANNQADILESLITGDGDVEQCKIRTLDEATETLERQAQVLRDIGNMSMQLLEPLSFQDLVGQRIQRIIKLVRSMEIRIEELIVSFGIKLRKHKEDPTKSFEDLKKEVDLYMTELQGPQREGQGLDQAGIDDLLEGL